MKKRALILMVCVLLMALCIHAYASEKVKGGGYEKPKPGSSLKKVPVKARATKTPSPSVGTLKKKDASISPKEIKKRKLQLAPGLQKEGTSKIKTDMPVAPSQSSTEDDDAVMKIAGYDRMHDMTRGRKSRAWGEPGIPDEDVMPFRKKASSGSAEGNGSVAVPVPLEDDNPSRITIAGYDKMHDITRGTESRTWGEDQIPPDPLGNPKTLINSEKEN